MAVQNLGVIMVEINDVLFVYHDHFHDANQEVCDCGGSELRGSCGC